MTMMEKLNKIFEDKELVAAIDAATTKEEVLEALRAKGIEMTEEELKQLAMAAHNQEKLGDEALNGVAGGVEFVDVVGGPERDIKAADRAVNTLNLEGEKLDEKALFGIAGGITPEQMAKDIGKKVEEVGGYVGGKIVEGAKYVGDKAYDGVVWFGGQIYDGVSWFGGKIYNLFK